MKPLRKYRITFRAPDYVGNGFTQHTKLYEATNAATATRKMLRENKRRQLIDIIETTPMPGVHWKGE